jgi:hypothetical protein
MPDARIASFLGVVLLLVLAFADPGVATAQPTKADLDVKSIAGKWTGTGHSSAGTNPLEWTIKEDGTVQVVVGTPSGPRTGVARMSVKDGALFYESGTSSGTVTLHEEGGRRVLKYEAVMKRDNTRGGAELTPVR